MSSGGSEEHAECICTQPSSKISVKNTTLPNWRDQTAANYVDDNTGSCCGAVDVENSFLGGGDYTLSTASDGLTPLGPLGYAAD